METMTGAGAEVSAAATTAAGEASCSGAAGAVLTVSPHKNAVLVTGETQKVKELLKGLNTGSWNKGLGGWCFPGSQRAAVLAALRKDPANTVTEGEAAARPPAKRQKKEEPEQKRLLGIVEFKAKSNSAMAATTQLFSYIKSKEREKNTEVAVSCVINFGEPGANGKTELEELVIGVLGYRGDEKDLLEKVINAASKARSNNPEEASEIVLRDNVKDILDKEFGRTKFTFTKETPPGPKSKQRMDLGIWMQI